MVALLVFVALLIGLFASSWLGLVTAAFCLAAPATGLVLSLAGENATPTLMAQAFFGIWTAAIVAAGVPYLFKRLFIIGPRRRRKPQPDADA